jgi:hypothetical protein
MAHMVRYNSDEGDRLAPTVSSHVNAKAHTSPADVMLVSALLHMYYRVDKPLPPGARYLIKPSGTFTDQTKLFITGYQRRNSALHPDGNVSVLPIGHTYEQLFNYTIFHVYSMVVDFTAGDADTVLQALKTYPHLHDLDKMVQGSPLREAPPPETGPGEVTGPTGPGTGSAQGLRRGLF